MFLGNACSIGFCVSFAFAFVLMSQIVKQDGPIISTLLTYGLSQLIILLIRRQHIRNILRSSLSNFRLFSWVNVLTCTNAILIYFILTHLTAFIYVIVFFGTLSASSYIISLKTNEPVKSNSSELFIGIVALSIGLASVWYGGNSTASDQFMLLLGLLLTVIASLVGAAYLFVSERFQMESGLATSDIVAARLTFTVVICAIWLFASDKTLTITFDTLSIYLIIALLGSVIPLFLLQKSNELTGPEGTSRFMPIIPVLCGVFSLILVPGLLTWVDALLGFVIFMAMGSRFLRKPKSHG